MNYKDKVQSTTILTKYYYTKNPLFQQTTNKRTQICKKLLLFKMHYSQLSISTFNHIKQIHWLIALLCQNNL